MAAKPPSNALCALHTDKMSVPLHGRDGHADMADLFKCLGGGIYRHLVTLIFAGQTSPHDIAQWMSHSTNGDWVPLASVENHHSSHQAKALSFVSLHSTLQLYLSPNPFFGSLNLPPHKVLGGNSRNQKIPTVPLNYGEYY